VTVTVRLYAGLREAAGSDRLVVETGTDGDVSTLRAALAEARPGLEGRLAACRFAIDDDFVPDDAPVPDGAVVDAIPPVSGG